MTKKEMYSHIISLNPNDKAIVDFCNHEIELLNRKASSNSKPTKTQLENEGYKSAILEILAVCDKPLTISEMMEYEALDGLKNQRVSALVTQLKNSGLVVRTQDKKKAYFSLAER